MFRAIQTRHAFQEVIEQILDVIRAGDLTVGDKLPSERDLAVIMDVSRPTLREAVRVLVENSVLRVQPGPTGGSFVASDIIPDELNSKPWAAKISQIADLLESRRILQPQAARLAALRATDEDLAVITRTWNELRGAVNQRQRFLQLDERFHIGIGRASQNSVLAQQLRDILRGLRIAKDFTLRDGLADVTQAYESQGRILKALFDRREDVAEREVIDHLRYLEGIWDDELHRALSRVDTISALTTEADRSVE